jgi:hypothetical protein
MSRRRPGWVLTSPSDFMEGYQRCPDQVLVKPWRLPGWVPVKVPMTSKSGPNEVLATSRLGLLAASQPVLVVVLWIPRGSLRRPSQVSAVARWSLSGVAIGSRRRPSEVRVVSHPCHNRVPATSRLGDGGVPTIWEWEGQTRKIIYDI